MPDGTETVSKREKNVPVIPQPEKAVPVTVGSLVTNKVPLAAELEALFASAEAGQIDETLKKVEVVQSNLADSDALALLNWSIGPRPTAMFDDAWHAITNNAWNKLRNQEKLVKEFVPKLSQFFRGPSASYVMKDYSIQHLGSHLEEQYTRLSQSDRAMVLAILKEGAAMKEQGFAGTALYSLQRVKEKVVDEAPNLTKELNQIALDLLTDSKTAKHAKISAIQIVLENGDKRGLDQARKIAADITSEPLLRAPAIAYLGCFGTQDDAKLLQTVSEGCSDQRLLSALTPAIAKLTGPVSISK